MQVRPTLLPHWLTGHKASRYLLCPTLFVLREQEKNELGRQKLEKSLAMVKAHKAIFWPTENLKQRNSDSWGDLNFCVHSTLSLPPPPPPRQSWGDHDFCVHRTPPPPPHPNTKKQQPPGETVI